jgi:hypothetical protein
MDESSETVKRNRALAAEIAAEIAAKGAAA